MFNMYNRFVILPMAFRSAKLTSKSAPAIQYKRLYRTTTPTLHISTTGFVQQTLRFSSSQNMAVGTYSRPAGVTNILTLNSKRHLSGNVGSNIVDIDEVVELSRSPKEGTTLVDVRNKHEMDYGTIPNAVNIPLPELVDALELDDEDFEDVYGVKKFNKADRVIFYCRSGVRSSNASLIASQMGYERNFNYKGSWLEWAERFNLPTY